MNRVEVGSLSEAARRAVLEVALIMAWADSRIDRSELGALEGVARSLRLSLSEDELVDLVDRGPLDIADLDRGLLAGMAGELAFLTAAWMAQVDETSVGAEDARLTQLGDQLQLEGAARTRLSALAADVHHRFDRSQAWGEEYRALIDSGAGGVP